MSITALTVGGERTTGETIRTQNGKTLITKKSQSL